MFMNGAKRGKRSGVIGLVLDSACLEGTLVYRENGSLRTDAFFTLPLSLESVTDDPAGAGREILKAVESAGIHERRCVVALPLKWVLTLSVTLPELAEADMASYLQIEAERGFPCDVSSLRLAVSYLKPPTGGRYALIVGVLSTQLQRLEEALHAARLKPVGFRIGISALQSAGSETDAGVLTLAVGLSGVGLQITCDGGVAALRSLENVTETDGRVSPDLVTREARITLGQLPSGMADRVKRIRIVGRLESVQQLAAGMRSRFEPAGLGVEIASRYEAEEWGAVLPENTEITPGFSLAAGHLMGQRLPFEFLPPAVSVWKRLVSRHLSGKVRTAVAAASVLIVLTAAAFGVQQWQLAWLETRWAGMAPTVHELETLQQQIRQYRSWYDDSCRSLMILRSLSLAFPEDGSVTAKTLEIRDINMVSCSGTARDNTALLRTLNQLRSADNVHDVRLAQIRGGSPMQFSFEFQYGEGGSGEN